MKNASASRASFAPLYWMALGAFAIGTEGFMIAGILPAVARELSVSAAAAGQLVTIFALAYAISSPLLTAISSRHDRRKLLLCSMSAFALGNVLAALSHSYWMLVGARVILALAAGVYMPAAIALASAMVEPARRGHALAIVSAGTTVAIALGVPLGALVGNAYGWHATFASVASLASLATLGLMAGLGPQSGPTARVAGLQERFALVRRPVVLRALSMTTLWSSGTYAVYTYLASLLSSATMLQPIHFGIAFFLWGTAAAAGVFAGGLGTDRFGARTVIAVGLPVLTAALLALSTTGHFVAPRVALFPVLAIIVVWGASAWAIHPAQQARLIQVAGSEVAPVALSLNASFLYSGFALGASIGAFTLTHGGIGDLGWVGALCESAAFLLLLSSGDETRPASTVTQSQPGQVAHGLSD
ncbi:MFS transporter [Paraburkholderia sp. DHOC27]|uniref:MFS transporter n=1 Tax=Paraburkholderia sp. DHOC27 TaxID=2303330 RepID=UPI000E3CCA40|nr:MFS transporter [Paraburkholderia sp. DHOC27]RFU44482.1 MFS transporter [Paraburkholderia sp. DHOC27]